MKYHIVTFGCQMNVHESEKIAGVLENLNYFPTEKMNDADIIVFNTCAIREGAQDRAFGNIGALKQLKKKNKNLIIAVGGCMTQQKHIAEKIYKTFPFVDIIYGTKNLNELSNYIENYNQIKKRQLNYSDKDIIDENMPIMRTSGDNAWVNIIYGCNNFCTYCIVPYVRGRERSRNKNDILKEIEGLLKVGYKKITLLGQNVNSYGNDDKINGNFAQLLNDICKLNYDFTLSFMTSHPKDLNDDIINQIAIQPKISKELHLPVQSGSNNILKSMNRKYTVEHYLEIIEKLKNKIPDIRLSTDIIVGFPGETEEDFNKTLELIKKVKFDNIFAFMYSIRNGTVAEKMENQIEDSIKHKRVNELLNLAKEIQKQKE